MVERTQTREQNSSPRIGTAPGTTFPRCSPGSAKRPPDGPKSFYKRCAKEGTKARIPPLQAPAPVEEHRDSGRRDPDARCLRVRGGRWWHLAVKGVPAARFCDRNGRLVSAPLNPVGIEKGLSRRMALSDGRYVPARTVHDVTIRRDQRRAWHGRGWDLGHMSTNGGVVSSSGPST